jgi:hypothetical protein
MQYLHGGIHVHGGAGKVIIIAHPDDIRVLKFTVKQRVRVGAVAVVGGPMFSRFWRKSGGVCRSGLGQQENTGKPGQQTIPDQHV